METIDPILNTISSLWDRITSAPIHLLLILALNALGVLLKRVPQIPNHVIPLILIGLATVGYPLLAGPGTVNPESRHPQVVLGIFGFLLGFGAWLLHLFLLKHAEKYLPTWLRGESTPPATGTPGPLALLLCAGLATLVFSGCGTMTVKEGADPIVVHAEQAAEGALETFDTFVLFEFQNRTALLALNPDIHKAAEEIRANGLTWIADLRAVTQAYKYNRSSSNRVSVITAQAILQTALQRARQHLADGQQKKRAIVPPSPPGGGARLRRADESFPAYFTIAQTQGSPWTR
jgi:hypothetical protein